MLHKKIFISWWIKDRSICCLEKFIRKDARPALKLSRNILKIEGKDGHLEY